MHAVISKQQVRLEALCREYHVNRLEVFGSAATGGFDWDSSDLDFLVEFLPLEVSARYEAFFGLWEDLRSLFGRKIDLVEPGAMRNPYFARRVNESRVSVYAA